MNEREIRQDICEVGRRLYARGLVAGADGNISVRLPRGRLLTTPTGCSKGFMRCEDLVVTDMTGRSLSGGRPSTEIRLHLAVYEKRADVAAVVHAHPPTAVAFTVAGASLEGCVMPEVLLYMGTVPTTRYATPASPEGPEVIAQLIADHDALLLDRHGAVTVGSGLFEAWERMEKLEHFAEVVLRARQLGGVRMLSDDEIARLEANARRLGHEVDFGVCRTLRCPSSSAGAPPAEGAASKRAPDADEIAALVVEELRSRGIA